MIVVALPQVARDLRVDVAETSWIVTSYLIAMAALQPIAGRVGDRLGRRNVMLAALVYFAVASAGAAAAGSILLLAVFRINQAIAAAALVPNGLGLLREAIPSGRRGAEFGIVSAATAVGATVGPLVGGFLAAIDWRWIFLVNVPLCAAGIALAAFSGGSIILAPLGGRAADRYGPRLPTVAGALLLGVGLTPLAISAGQLPIELLAGTLAFAGVGLALTFPSMRLAAVEVVPERYAALASGVFSTSRYFGGMLGSIAIAIALGGSPATDSLRTLFWLLTAAAFAAAIPSLALPGQGLAHPEPLAEEAAG